ncbi:hypothetical protein V3C99_006039, partial [Haemonchus contortus]
ISLCSQKSSNQLSNGSGLDVSFSHSSYADWLRNQRTQRS